MWLLPHKGKRSTLIAQAVTLNKDPLHGSKEQAALTCHHATPPRSPSYAAARDAACHAQKRRRPHILSEAFRTGSISPPRLPPPTLSVRLSVCLLGLRCSSLRSGWGSGREST